MADVNTESDYTRVTILTIIVVSILIAFIVVFRSFSNSIIGWRPWQDLAVL